MTGDFSHEALAAIVGEDLVADAERRAIAACAPAPEALATLKRVCGPTVQRLTAQERRRTQVADAA